MLHQSILEGGVTVRLAYEWTCYPRLTLDKPAVGCLELTLVPMHVKSHNVGNTISKMAALISLEGVKQSWNSRSRKPTPIYSVH